MELIPSLFQPFLLKLDSISEIISKSLLQIKLHDLTDNSSLSALQQVFICGSLSCVSQSSFLLNQAQFVLFHTSLVYPSVSFLGYITCVIFSVPICGSVLGESQNGWGWKGSQWVICSGLPAQAGLPCTLHMKSVILALNDTTFSLILRSSQLLNYFLLVEHITNSKMFSRPM